MASSSGRQPNFAALNRGHHLYSAGRPSRRALAHISSYFCFIKFSFGLIKLSHISTFNCVCYHSSGAIKLSVSAIMFSSRPLDVLKAKFHYAIPLANQLASRFATWSSRPGMRPASDLVADLLATWTAMEFCLSRAILLASSSLAARRAAANRSATAGSSYLDMSR